MCRECGPVQVHVNRINDVLRDPQHGHGNQRNAKPENQAGYNDARRRFPYHAENRRNISQRLQPRLPLRPWRLLRILNVWAHSRFFCRFVFWVLLPHCCLLLTYFKRATPTSARSTCCEYLIPETMRRPSDERLRLWL